MAQTWWDDCNLGEDIEGPPSWRSVTFLESADDSLKGGGGGGGPPEEGGGGASPGAPEEYLGTLWLDEDEGFFRSLLRPAVVAMTMSSNPGGGAAPPPPPVEDDLARDFEEKEAITC